MTLNASNYDQKWPISKIIGLNAGPQEDAIKEGPRTSRNRNPRTIIRTTTTDTFTTPRFPLDHPAAEAAFVTMGTRHDVVTKSRD